MNVDTQNEQTYHRYDIIGSIIFIIFASLHSLWYLGTDGEKLLLELKE